jgi:hypothetical protein
MPELRPRSVSPGHSTAAAAAAGMGVALGFTKLPYLNNLIAPVKITDTPYFVRFVSTCGISRNGRNGIGKRSEIAASLEPTQPGRAWKS